jgi:hypothetical protein
VTARPAALSGKGSKKDKDSDVRPVARNRKAFTEYFIEE